MGFEIYNASAGSGKTFTLVKEFLKILLKTQQKNINSKKKDYYFKRVLAITFTNKAVKEMKERVINELITFSSVETATEDQMFKSVSKELQLTQEEVIKRANIVLADVLHNYSDLSISTIDGFNHRLIRAFAFDLELDSNFKVSMDLEKVISQAVDNLLKKVGEDEELTQMLINFSKQKINDSKSWDVAGELEQMCKKLMEEDSFEYFKELEDKKKEDFKALAELYKSKKRECEQKIEENVKSYFEFMKGCGIEEKGDFPSTYIYNFFDKYRTNRYEIKEDTRYTTDYFWKKDKDDTVWIKKLREGEDSWCKKEFVKKNEADVDEIRQKTAKCFKEVRYNSLLGYYYKELLRFLPAMAVVKHLNEEIKAIKDEENILLISEFNKLIKEKIMTQPEMFIYERIGERYRHFFIDEFQDTSGMQWSNIQPLIKNNIQAEEYGLEGSLMIVGDAKQSIYRFRGGKAEQFIDLYDRRVNPFDIESEVFDLKQNYRSEKAVVEFNNGLYKYICEEVGVFSSKEYKGVYSLAGQEVKKKGEGYVKVEFLDSKKKENEEAENDSMLSELDKGYGNKVLGAVLDACECGFEKKDICVLVRSKAQGTKIAQILTQNGVEVISAESLLLENMEEVKFLIDLLKLSIGKDNDEVEADMLTTYSKIKNISDEQRGDFLLENMGDIAKFFKERDFSFDKLYENSFYEGVSNAIKSFELAGESDGYMSEFLNIVFEFSNKNSGGVSEFLDYWGNNSGKFGVPLPEGMDAVRIMTIHKSKGLEFDVVIYPYVNDTLADNSKDRDLWLPLKADENKGFEHIYINSFAELSYLPETREILLIRKEQKTLDTVNVFYVATTRAKKHLYIISDINSEKAGGKVESLADVLFNFVQKNGENEQWVYEFGERKIQEKKEKEDVEVLPFAQRNSDELLYTIVTRRGLLWTNNRLDHIEKGNLVHMLMAEVIYKDDVEGVVNSAVIEGLLQEKDAEEIARGMNEIIGREEIKDYYTDRYEVMNEREFYNGVEFLRPDRVVVEKGTKNCVIIDYKTGVHNDKYLKQMVGYKAVLEEVGYKVEKVFLVYPDGVEEVI